MQFPYYYTPVAGNYSPAERDAMFAKIQNADTPGNLASYNGVLALAPRPNLLDNAYFVGGGSGYGVFPVNQRGVTQYSAAGNIFDRWKLVSGTATLTAAGLVLNGTITQTISPAPVGVLTCSALTTAGLVTPTYSNGVFTLVGTGQTFIAARLERGSISTLAHQESGAWVLNEIPRYDDELRECQRYYRRYLRASSANNSAYLQGILAQVTNGSATFCFQIPEMQTAPTITLNDSLQIRAITSGGALAGTTTYTAISASRTLFYVRADNTNIQAGGLYQMATLVQGNALELSAELN